MRTPAESARAWVAGHDVQFYENEEFLASTVAVYLVEGVRAGQPLVVIANRAHRESIAQKMRTLGVDPDDLVHARDAVWLDAAEALDGFMQGGRPDPELFAATIGNVFEKLMAGRRYIVVRAYGEMVDLLWKEGKADAAIAVEKLWNALATAYSFSLLCSYSRASLMADSHPNGLERICGEHARVRPSEFELRSDGSVGLRAP